MANRALSWSASAFVLFALGCGDDSTSSGTGAGGSPSSSSTGGSGATGGSGGSGAAGGSGGSGGVVDVGDLFDPDRIIEISIDLSATDAVNVEEEERVLLTYLGTEDCLAAPWSSPYDFYPATVTVEGVTRENVGVRKHGFMTTTSSKKPSLRIDFKEFVDGQTLGEYERMSLVHSTQDPSLIRTCLAYDLFRKAGLLAPRCNFAHVTFEGEDLGIYANVENINRDFLDEAVDDDTGTLYQGEYSDFTEGFTGTFEKETNDETPDLPEVDALTAALTVTDAELETSLAPIVVLDEFYAYWAMEVLTNHWDGYTNNANNFFVYDDPDAGGLRMIVSSPDGTFRTENPAPAGPDAPISVFATSKLPRRLYLDADTRADYITKLEALLASTWDEAAIGMEIDRMEALLVPIAGTEIEAPIEAVRAFVSGRRAALEAELAGGAVAWTFPERGSPCLAPTGTVEGSFDTTYGTSGMDPFTAGDGALEVTLGQTLLPLTTIGARAGEDDAYAIRLQVVGLRGDGQWEVLATRVPNELATAGTFRFDRFNTTAELFVVDPMTMNATSEGLVTGSLTFSDCETTAGAPVTGTFAGTLLGPAP